MHGLLWKNARIEARVMARLLRKVNRRPWLGIAASVCGLIAARGLPASAQAVSTISAPLYRTAAPILALSPEQAGRGDSAQLRGVVIRSTDYGFILQDGTAGIWIFLDHPPNLSPHDEIEVKGIVHQGRFSPGVTAQSIRKLGSSPLPKPETVTFKQLSTGDKDSQYVSVTGVVRSVGLRPRVSSSQKLWLKIAMADGFIDASFPEEDLAAANNLIDAVVRIDGAASCTKNQNRQIITPTLMVSGMESLTVLRPPPNNLFDTPLTPISKLMQYRSGTDYYHRVMVAGTVIYYKAGEGLILEDAGRALFVETTQASDIKLGDRVEALGFPAPESSGPILQDAILRSIATGQQLRPTPVTITDLSSGAFNYNLVSIEGRFLTRVHEPYREVLLLQNQSGLLLAELAEPENSNALQKLKEGSTIRISGISMLDVTGIWNMDAPSASAIRYKVLLRSSSDLQVVGPPSWWTTRHVIYLAAILGVLVLALVGLEVYRRIERWRLRAVLEERERLAHEMHDTLAQSFAGIGFQLQAIRRAVPSDAPGLRVQVDLARALVRYSHKEAKRSVEPLNLGSEASEEIDVLSSLEASARKMVEGTSVAVTTARSGTSRSVPPKMATSLLRIGQEAVANAVRHANPSRLDIAIAYLSDSVKLAVTDDGCGFVSSGSLIGFGLRGMRKRAAALSARLEIVSQPGEGTRVEINVPLPPRLSFHSFLEGARKYLVEHRSYGDPKTK
jgi:signal transduction histidine kinase